MTNILNTIAYLLLLDDLEPWMKWGYYASPMSYAQNAIAINEFLDKRWSTVSYTIMFTNSDYHQHIIISLHTDLFLFSVTMTQVSPRKRWARFFLSQGACI